MKILNQNKKVVDKVDLGIVEAGKTQEFEYFLLNDSNAEIIDIKLEVANKEVEVLNFPEKLDSKEEGVFTLKWSPSISVKSGLKALIKITGSELWR